MAIPVLLPNAIQPVHRHSDYEGVDVQAKWTHTTTAGDEKRTAICLLQRRLEMDGDPVYSGSHRFAEGLWRRRSSGALTGNAVVYDELRRMARRYIAQRANRECAPDHCSEVNEVLSAPGGCKKRRLAPQGSHSRVHLETISILSQTV